MQFQLADRIQFEQRQQSDRITRLEARIAALERGADSAPPVGAQPSAPLAGAQPSSAKLAEHPSKSNSDLQPSGDNVSPHPSPCNLQGHPFASKLEAHPVEVPELDLASGTALTAGPLRKA